MREQRNWNESASLHNFPNAPNTQRPSKKALNYNSLVLLCAVCIFAVLCFIHLKVIINFYYIKFMYNEIVEILNYLLIFKRFFILVCVISFFFRNFPIFRHKKKYFYRFLKTHLWGKYFVLFLLENVFKQWPIFTFHCVRTFLRKKLFSWKNQFVLSTDFEY